jgi:hypothetical protein
VDATMKRNKFGSIVAAVVSLALVPALWIMAFGGIPPLETVRADTSGGRLGPWVFTWGLVWIATLACVAVAWACVSSMDDANT